MDKTIRAGADVQLLLSSIGGDPCRYNRTNDRHETSFADTYPIGVRNSGVLCCDLEECKQNKNGDCVSDNPIFCPKNNEQSIFENLDLLK